MTTQRIPDGNGAFVRVDPHTGTTGLDEPAYNQDPITAPATGRAAIYPRKVAGRERWYQRGSTGAAMAVAAEAWAKIACNITPRSGATLRTNGYGGDVTSVGTVSHPGTTANGYLAQVVSAASAAAVASVQTIGAFVRRGAAGDLLGGFFYRARLYFPDASYDNTGASTGSRAWAGLMNSTSAVPTDRGSTFHVAAFARAQVNGGATDANWQFVTNNGGTGTSTAADTGVPFVAQHVYDVALWCPLGGTTIYWRIKDVTAGTAAVEGTATATLPGATTPLAAVAAVETVDAVARALQFAQVYVESDQG